jgi:hypothetical protein
MRSLFRAFLVIGIMGFFSCNQIFAQEFSYRIQINSLQIPELGGIQSYAYAQWENKWLIIGGRLDGLHRRQPWASFDSAGNNTQIIVIDPIERKKWSANVNHFHTDLREQLSSTNMEFKQVDSLLILIGGYGYSPSKKDHITYPNLAVVNVPQTINAITNGYQEFFTIGQIPCETCAVTGGKLMTIDSTFYLIGGHRFDGKYNPMGGPTFVQTYTNAVQKFRLKRVGNATEAVWLDKHIDEYLLHRRDLNVLPQISDLGEPYLSVFSGVFQTDYDMPYLTSVRIDKDTIYAEPDFMQYYNHYHCATTSIYDAQKSTQYNLFFGGISQYSDSSGVLIQDSDIPFVQNISLIERDSNSRMKEYLFETKMPGYLGAGSEFIANPNLNYYPNGVLNLNANKKDSILLGYLYGGIKSSAASIFWINDGTQSIASQAVYPIYLIKDSTVTPRLNAQSCNGLQLQVFPDVNYKEFYISYQLEKVEDVNIEIKTLSGQVVVSKQFKKRKMGMNQHTLKYKKLDYGQSYFFTLKLSGAEIVQKIMVN